jgi:hypothetical protein
MLFGFELFMCLKSDLSADTIEVYPFAIDRYRPRISAGVCAQVERRRVTETNSSLYYPHGVGTAEAGSEAQADSARKPTHRLDAFMAAWIASLPLGERRAVGNDQRPDDAIWVPV